MGRGSLSLVVGFVRRGTALKWGSADFGLFRDGKSPTGSNRWNGFRALVRFLKNYFSSDHGHPNFGLCDFLGRDRKDILGEHR